MATLACLPELTLAANKCTVSNTPLPFGTYSPSGQLNNTASLNINCKAPAAVKIKINPGNNSTGGFNRNMKIAGATSLLNYNLYVDPARTIIWGNGTLGTQTRIINAPAGQAPVTTVYGRVPAGQWVPAGSYTDLPQILFEF